MKVINLENKKEYEIFPNKTGENSSICPVCSSERRKKTDKCFSFNLQKGAGKCNHCGVVLVEKKDFEQKPSKIDFKPLFFKSNTEYSLDLQKFFKSRLISEKTLIKLRITEGVEWMPQFQAEINTIQFNYFFHGELINTKYRGKKKSFKLIKDAPLLFYNIDAVINNDTIIIVEGEMDCLAMHEAGYSNTISVPNGATTGKINLEYLDNCIDYFLEDTKFILALDNDLPGKNLETELARRLGYENCSRVSFKDCKDANECLIKYGIQGIIESISERKEFPIQGVFDANDIKEDIYNFYYNGLPKGSGIGLSEFDHLLKFQEGYITTITGIPGHGKSEFLDFILCRLNISHGWKIALYSPENHPLELHFSKFAEKLTGKPFEGNLRMVNSELENVIKYHADNFFFINPKEDFTIDSILASVKSLIRKKGIKAFVIDAWNKLDHHYTTSETKYISEQLDKLTMFCQKNKVHLFLVAHPTKINKDKTTGLHEIPNLYNISGSANFYNKTANGICVYRNFTSTHTEIYIQKVKFKHWGQTGCVKLCWDYKTGRYYQSTPSYDSWIVIKEKKELENNTEFLTDIQQFEGKEPF